MYCCVSKQHMVGTHIPNKIVGTSKDINECTPKCVCRNKYMLVPTNVSRTEHINYGSQDWLSYLANACYPKHVFDLGGGRGGASTGLK